MADRWISTKKHYCETCRCWLSAHKYNIKHHERSTRHLENFRKLLKESSARRDQETKEQEFLEKELQKLDKVEKQYLASLNKNEKLKNNNNNTIHDNNNIIHNTKNNINNNSNNNNNNNTKNNNNIKNKITTVNTSNNYFRNVSYTSSKYNPSKYDDTQKEPKQNKTRNEYMKWLVMIDANTGRLIFLNKENNEIKQEPPENFSGQIPKQEAFAEQNGWYKHFDNYANCFYYYNVNTSQCIWEYSPHNINCFIAYVKQWENANTSNCHSTNTFNYTGSNTFYANYWQTNHSNINSYASNGNDLGIYTNQFNEWYSQGVDKEKKENNEKNKNENNEPGKVYMSLNLNKQKNQGGTEQQGNNQTDSQCLENNALLRENEKKIIENAQKKEETKKNNISTISDGGGSTTDANVTKDLSVKEKNEQKPVKKKRISRWDQCYVKTEVERVKEITEMVDYKEKEIGGQMKKKEEKEEKEDKEDKENGMIDTMVDTKEEIPKKKIKMDLNIEESTEDKLTQPNNQVQLQVQDQDKKDDQVGIPGTWEVVENPKVHTIPIDNVEDIFYKIKSRDQLEKEELLNLEEHIKNEYSQYNQFYVKKKELENPELFLNQEFQFVNKPVFIKATDKKNMQKENVTFAKRNIKAKNKKGEISNAN